MRFAIRVVQRIHLTRVLFLSFLTLVSGSVSQSQTVIDLDKETPGDPESVTSILGKTPYHLLGAGGQSLGMGDFDGDGIGDLAVSAPSANTETGGAGAGEIYLFYGDPDFPSLGLDLENPSGEIRVSKIHGGIPYERAGQALAVGDINADDYDDLIVGAPASVGSGTRQAGTVYVVYGAADLPNRTIELGVSINSSGVTRILGREAADVTGWSVASGDVDSDGFDDIIVGSLDLGTESPEDIGTSWRGKVRVVYGSPGLPKSVVDLSEPTGSHGETTILGIDDFSSQVNGDQFGRSLAAGDVNGDGFDDIIAGAPNSDRMDHQSPNAGEAWVLYGSASIPGTTLDLSDQSVRDLSTGIFGAAAHHRTGAKVAVGDINGDGYSDVMVGSPYIHRRLPLEDFNGETAYEVGQVEIIFGGQTIPGKTYDLSDTGVPLASGELAHIIGPASDASPQGLGGGRFGLALGATDLNGDGRDDILATAPFLPLPDRVDAGQLSVLYGSPALEGASVDLLFDRPDFRIDGRGRQFTGAGIFENFGKAVIGGSDLNGDGIADLFASTPFADSPNFPEVIGSKAGEIVGYFGETGESVASRVRFTRSGNAPPTGFGPTLRCSIDFEEGSNLSRTEVLLVREPAKGLPNILVSWQVQSDRQDFESATVRFKYLPSETESVPEAELGLFFSADGETYAELPNQTINFQRNEISADTDEINGTFAIGSTGVQVTATPTIDPNATPTPFPADINLDGRVDADDLMIFLQDWMKTEETGGSRK